MTYFALNLVLAFVWMLLYADFSFESFLVGMVIGFLALLFSRPVLGSDRYVRAVKGTFRLIAVFLYELVVANLHLARDLLRADPPFKPGFISFDVQDLPPVETVLLSNMISLTPGTLSVDSDDEGLTLYVHSVYAQDPEQVRRGFRKFANLIHGALGGDPYYPEQEVKR